MACPQRLPLHSMKLVLASSSPYRRALLERLQLSFSVDPAAIDESQAPDEAPLDLARRLAFAKATTVGARHPSSLVIGSDQIAIRDTEVLHKPGNREANVEQLLQASGRQVEFHTGLCLLNTGTGRHQLDAVSFSVTFRKLSEARVRAYVEREQAYDCAGGFKAEGLGVALFEQMHGTDPSALMGLPLIRLVEMLGREGLDVL